MIVRFLCLCVILLSACAVTFTGDLDRTTYDLGPELTYYVHPTKIKLVDVDDGVLDFDIISKVELSNPTDDTLSFDVSCVFYRNRNILLTKKLTDLRVKSGKNKFVKIVYKVRYYSVYGHYARCKVKVFRVR